MVNRKDPPAWTHREDGDVKDEFVRIRMTPEQKLGLWEAAAELGERFPTRLARRAMLRGMANILDEERAKCD